MEGSFGGAKQLVWEGGAALTVVVGRRRDQTDTRGRVTSSCDTLADLVTGQFAANKLCQCSARISGRYGEGSVMKECLCLPFSRFCTLGHLDLQFV